MERGCLCIQSPSKAAFFFPAPLPHCFYSPLPLLSGYLRPPHRHALRHLCGRPQHALAGGLRGAGKRKGEPRRGKLSQPITPSVPPPFPTPLPLPPLQPPIELLRQWMDHGGWYDRSDNTFRHLHDIQFVAAMGPPGGGRNSVTPRLVRHFNLISITEFDDDTYMRIYTSIADWWFRCVGGEVGGGAGARRGQ